MISSAVKTAVPLWMGLGPAAVAGPPVAAAVGAARVARRVGKKLIGRGVWDKVKTGLKIAGTVAEHVLLPPKKTRFILGPDGFEVEEKYNWNDAGWKARQERGMRQRMRENERKWYAEDKMSGNGFWDKAKKVAKVALPAAALAGMTYLGAKEGKHAWDTRKAVHAMRKRNFDNGNISIHDVADFVGDGLRKRGGQRRQRGGALPAFLLPAVSYLAPAATAYAKSLALSAILHAIQTTMNLTNYEPGEWVAYLRYQLRQLFTTKFLIDGPMQQFLMQKAQQAVYGLPQDVKELAVQAVRQELAAAANKQNANMAPGLNGPVPFVSASAHA